MDVHAVYKPSNMTLDGAHHPFSMSTCQDENDISNFEVWDAISDPNCGFIACFIFLDIMIIR